MEEEKPPKKKTNIPPSCAIEMQQTQANQAEVLIPPSGQRRGVLKNKNKFPNQGKRQHNFEAGN